MPEKTLTRSKGTLGIAVGAGDPIEIDADEAAELSGRSIRQALTHIIDRHVRDPELREMLNTPHLTLELHAKDDQDQAQESRITPGEKWDTVLDPMAEGKTVVVGMSERHHGGSTGRPGRETR